MNITEKDLEVLRSYKNKPNENDVRYKEIIKQVLLENDLIPFLIDNKELEDADAENDEYFNINILPYYMIPDTQTNVKNFICYEISFDDVARYNTAIKVQQIIFHILCRDKQNYVQEVGCCRHDLISAVIIDLFQGSNIFGNQLKLISNKPGTTDNHYCTRTLIFEQQTTNSLTKQNGRSFNLR